MQDDDKSKEQLLAELTELRQQMAESQSFEEDLLRMQYDISVALNAASSLGDAMDQLLASICRIQGLDCGGVYLVDKDSGDLNLVAYTGLSREFVERTFHYPANTEQVRMVMAGQPIYRPFDQALPAIYKANQHEGMQSIAVIPVQCDGQIVAALNLASRSDTEIPLTARRALEAISAQVGSTIAKMETEVALRSSEERYRLLADTVTDVISIMDLTGRWFYISPSIETLRGYTAEEALQQSMQESLAPDSYQQAMTALRAQIDAEIAGESEPISTRFEMEMTCKDGSTVWTEVISNVMRDEQGDFRGILTVTRDISHQKEAEEALQRYSERINALYEINRAILAAQSPRAIAQAALSYVRHLVPCMRASIVSFDIPSGKAIPLAVDVDDLTSVAAGARTDLDYFRTDILELGQVYSVEDIQALESPTPLEKALYEEGICSYINIPLLASGELVGALNLGSDQPGSFGADDAKIAREVASSLAIAIRQARLYQQTRRDAHTKSVLLKEVNHRVTNNLTATIGLLYTEQLHADRNDGDCGKMVDAVANRLHGLVTAHRMLSAVGWAPLLLCDLATQVIQSTLQMVPRNKRVDVNVPPSPVQVTPEQAHSLALLINELATNSIRHGLPDSHTIGITVNISTEDDNIRFEFRDDGPGYPPKVLEQEDYNVGLYLLQNLATHDLGGKFEIFNARGAVSIIQFRNYAAQIDESVD